MPARNEKELKRKAISHMRKLQKTPDKLSPRALLPKSMALSTANLLRTEAMNASRC